MMLEALSAALAPETQCLALSSETEAMSLLTRSAPATLICTPSLKAGCSLNLAKSARNIEGVSVILMISSKSDLGLSSKMLDHCDAIIAEWDLDHHDQPLKRAFQAISANRATYFSPSINDHLYNICQQVATLTPREKTVLDLILTGLSNQEIADRLTISASTAKSYSRDVLRKLGARNRHEVILKGFKLGLLGDKQ